MKRMKRTAYVVLLCVALVSLLCVPVLAAPAGGGSGDVSGAIESTWTAASGQLKTIVNNVVFPALDMILAIFFFVKLGASYFDYRKHGQFEWAGHFAGLPDLHPDRAHLYLGDRRDVRTSESGYRECGDRFRYFGGEKSEFL